MKKFLILLPLLFFVIFPKSIALADESSSSAMASPTAAMAVTNYTLPYPGILPDNPLYFFKVLRDNIVAFFISDPVKKSEFYLLQSDKRLEASWYLLKEGPSKDALALTTLAKSTNYFSLAVDEEQKVQATGNTINASLDDLKNAMAKHLSIIDAMIGSPGLTNAGDFVKEKKRLQNVADVVSKFRSK